MFRFFDVLYFSIAFLYLPLRVGEKDFQWL